MPSDTFPQTPAESDPLPRPGPKGIHDLGHPDYYFNRELTWLQFNERVHAEVLRKLRHPLKIVQAAERGLGNSQCQVRTRNRGNDRATDAGVVFMDKYTRYVSPNPKGTIHAHDVNLKPQVRVVEVLVDDEPSGQSAKVHQSVALRASYIPLADVDLTKVEWIT